MSVAWATMGGIQGEAILPAAVFALLATLCWRDLWITSAAVFLGVVTPVLLILQKGISFGGCRPTD